jgi:hypothetical protein
MSDVLKARVHLRHSVIRRIGDRVERIAPSYVTRLLWLNLLAPDIIDAILEGRQGSEVTLARLLEPFPLEWNRQAIALRQK